jgi:hypothetical protein
MADTDHHGAHAATLPHYHKRRHRSTRKKPFRPEQQHQNTEEIGSTTPWVVESPSKGPKKISGNLKKDILWTF